MHVLILLREFLEDIRKQKIRAFLTIAAITWGTLAVVLLMAFGTGLTFRMKESFLNAADNVIRVYGGQTTLKFQGLPIGRQIRLVEQDAYILQQTIRDIDEVCPLINRGVRLVRGEKIASTHMEGVFPQFEHLRRMYPSPGGRFINDNDLKDKKRVVFLGGEIAAELFGDENPIGQLINLDGIPFTVVGTMPKKLQTSMNNGPDDRRAIIPFTTFQGIYGDRYLDELLVRPKPGRNNLVIKNEIFRVIGQKYKFDPTDERALGVWDMIEMAKASKRIFIGINAFLAVIGAMTLIIAGVGVANIMYVVAKERTKEIGIKRAIGARKRHILFQFIFESLLISTIGGGVGLLLASGIIKLMWTIPVQSGPMEFLSRPILSDTVMLVVVSVLALIGLLAGFFPARKASKVSPVEALRYE
ncbi:ABC transporter permease [bacterium]|nr:ABC transporter permease [bacterium]